MFHGNRASSYDTLARKSRPPIAFDWNYFLQTAMIWRIAEAQRWRVLRTSVAGMKAAAIGRIFDIPERTVRGILARKALNKANPEGVK